MILKIFHIQKVHRPTVYCLVNYIHVWAMKPVLFTTSSDIYNIKSKSLIEFCH